MQTRSGPGVPDSRACTLALESDKGGGGGGGVGDYSPEGTKFTMSPGQYVFILSGGGGGGGGHYSRGTLFTTD